MPSQKTTAGSPANDLYLDAPQAAAMLNVSLPTLYTYVTRKNIRSHKPPGSRASRYLRSDIELLKEGGPAPSGRQSAPGLAVSSSITLLADGHAYYRGRKATDIAETSTLEDVARLLWAVDGEDPFAQPPLRNHANWAALLKATEGFDALDRISMLLPAMEAANARAHDLGKDGFLRSGVDILRHSAAIEFGQKQQPGGPIHRFIAAATRCGPGLEDAIRRVLVLSADIALEPATYAVRAAANAGATPYRCVAAGLATAGGKRLPSVRAASFARFIGEIDAAADPSEPVTSRIRESEAIPGFGFSPLGGADSRAIHLWRALRNSLKGDRRFARFDAALEAAQALTGKDPDFALLAAYVTLRLKAEHRPNLVRIGRLVGWIAHALEQQTDSPLVRWRVNYKGPLPAG